MNETKSSRYHRLRRRAGAASLLWTALLLVAALVVRPPLPLWAYVLALLALNELAALPIAFYRTFLLDRRYELSSEPAAAWFRDHGKAVAIGALFALGAAGGLYLLIERRPAGWWWIAAGGATLVTAGLARIAPTVLLPLFYKFTPLDRPELSARLLTLSKRAGVPVLGVFVWGLGAKTRRANAALTGTGATRRILLSDTLLDQYSDDEIEVIIAHEMAHHVHRDIPKTLLLEFGLMLAAFYAAEAGLAAAVAPLGLQGPADPRGLPLLAAVAGGVLIAATPLVNAFSRFNERRADRFALALTQRSDAFVSAMRRLGSQNLAEENPSRAAVLLFHSHPPIEERIAAARIR